MSVWNGEAWKNYGVLDGPLGERVFDIAADPRPSPDGGDIWIASSRGLARYHLDEDRWSYLTRADGLPSDQMEAIAFAEDGTLLAGTQCDGLSIARPADDYTTWETATAPEADRIETEPVGAGLPSDQFNDVLVHSDGTVYAATVRGLARSTDGGGSWTYTRGRDYADKVKRRFEGPPKGWKPWPAEGMAKLLPEDYVTALAEAPDGRLWIGFRQHGLLLFDPATGATEALRVDGSALTEDFVTGIVLTAGGAWAGTYGGGVAKIEPVDDLSLDEELVPPAALFAVGSDGMPPHPSTAEPPTVEELETLAASTQDINQGEDALGVLLEEDWETKGDWLGRLGRSRTILCAMSSPLNQQMKTDSRVKVRGHVGPHHEEGELLRHWVHRPWWDDRRVLYSPVSGYRRQASWDDHAEAYPMSYEGPDVWVEFEVPDGLHRAAFYFFNKDGHRGRNRYRDYLLELKTGRGPDPGLNQPMRPSVERRGDLLATARVREFWGGVWQCFAVQGPGTFRLKIGCNDSFNTIVSAVCIDQFSGSPDPENVWGCLPYAGGDDYLPPVVPVLTETAAVQLKAAAKLVTAHTQQSGVAGLKPNFYRDLRFALRAARAVEVPTDLIRNWRWLCRRWTPTEREEFDAAIARLWSSHLKYNPHRAAIRARDLQRYKGR